MNLDDLKKNWNDLKVDDSVLADENARLRRELTGQRLCSTRDRLRRRLRRMACMALALVIVMPCLGRASQGLLSDWLVAVTCVFITLMGLINLMLSFRLNDIDLSRDTTVEALRKTVAFARLRQWCKAGGMVVGVVIIGMMIYEFAGAGDIWIVYGACAGAVVGLIIGLYIDRSIRRLIKDMIKELDHATE